MEKPVSVRKFLKDHPTIPRGTFRHWIIAKHTQVGDISTSGPDTMLSDQDEEDLGLWLLDMAGYNLCVSIGVLQAKAETLRVLAGGAPSTNRKEAHGQMVDRVLEAMGREEEAEDRGEEREGR